MNGCRWNWKCQTAPGGTHCCLSALLCSIVLTSSPLISASFLFKTQPSHSTFPTGSHLMFLLTRLPPQPLLCLYCVLPMLSVGRVNKEKTVVIIRTEEVEQVKKEEGGKDIEEKEEQCQNCAPGSNRLRQARPPAFTLYHDCDLFFSTPSSIHHLSGPSVAALLLSSPLRR